LRRAFCIRKRCLGPGVGRIEGRKGCHVHRLGDLMPGRGSPVRRIDEGCGPLLQCRCCWLHTVAPDKIKGARTQRLVN
jgi:hypothetical protein